MDDISIPVTSRNDYVVNSDNQNFFQKSQRLGRRLYYSRRSDPLAHPLNYGTGLTWKLEAVAKATMQWLKSQLKVEISPIGRKLVCTYQ